MELFETREAILLERKRAKVTDYDTFYTRFIAMFHQDSICSSRTEAT